MSLFHLKKIRNILHFDTFHGKECRKENFSLTDFLKQFWRCKLTE